MLNARKTLSTLLLSIVVSPVCAESLLQGDATVNITSDTAVNAKNIAFDEARRQILSDSLQQYVDTDALKEILKTTKASDLATMVASSSIGDEMTSNTTYSAKISITFADSTVRNWLASNNIQHWLPDTTQQNLFPVVVELSDKVPQWIELSDIARAEKIKFQPQKISGNIINIVMPLESRGAFTIALRERGWKYADQDGVLRIWKKQ